MTMTSSRRILKSADVPTAAVIDVEPPKQDLPEEPLLFTASETEALCETARQSGAEEALAGLAPTLESIAASLRDLADRTPESRALAFRADSAALIETSISIAEWVVGQELQSPDVVAALVDQALAEHDTSGAQRIRVAPDVADALEDLLPDDVDVVADRNMSNGAFLVQTDGPDIGLQVDAALDRARAALLETVTTEEAA
jgi:flagellar biosynthesis/type III secretory pathway protein FliH